MKYWLQFRALIALLLAGQIASTPARALVSLNDSHDHIYVTGTFGISRDSNVFASSNSPGDYVYSSGITAEYTRRAGWIGVNANMSISAGHFGLIKGQDFLNPAFGIELTKQTGRTTGSFGLALARESRADAAVNLRSSSWHATPSLSFAYPIVDRLKFSGSLGYDSRKYIDETALTNLTTYSVNTDLFYVLTNERDLTAGYRYRYNETSRSTSSTDHALTAGLSGRLIRGFNGSLRAGYQVRVPQVSGRAAPKYQSWTASGSTAYALNRKIKITGSIAKDFSTSANDTSIDNVSVGLDTGYAYNRRWNLSGGVAWADSRFLGESGRVVIAPGPPAILGAHRHDTNISWHAALGYTLNEHLAATFGYSWFENASTVAFADFVRSNWNLNFSSHW